MGRKTNTGQQNFKRNWRELQLEKKRILVRQLGRAITSFVARREDQRIQDRAEQTPIEGERVTRELAKRCGMEGHGERLRTSNHGSREVLAKQGRALRA